jgi:hypothetical protein
MQAAENLRAGKRAQYQALEKSGINTHTVELLLFLSETGPRHYAGKSGTRQYTRLTLSPTPEVTFSRKIAATPNGFENQSDVTLKGAFPTSLSGTEVTLDSDGQQSASIPTLQNYDAPAAFRMDIEAADLFLIDGEKYRFRGHGFLNTDRMESEWTLQLVRVEK